ncbi:hypothetical protein GOP47_0005716 [Adiantum capillus-veneris]|uniref:Uncharacterized protein n=1 Tax=Adiantum capillus-veneris TaxID=13818 RepID=A0A9D4V6A7_ADICA|nr:hypothetical protein GOP47_0005716 [Adiantum capillus-veneris]
MTAKVQEPAISEEEYDSSHSSSSSLDTDSMWETESISFRYESYDVFHVDEVEQDVYELPTSHLKVKEEHSARVEMPCVNRPVKQPYLVSRDGESLLEEEVWFHCASDLIEEQVFEDDLQELGTEAVVDQVDLSMQGVGQHCLDGHVEVYFEVSEFVCSRGELAPADDSMETHTSAAYKGEVPCKEEGTTNLAGDEVFDEQVEARAGHTLEYEKVALEPFSEGLDTGLQRDHVCLVMQQVEANGKH